MNELLKPGVQQKKFGRTRGPLGSEAKGGWGEQGKWEDEKEGKK